MLIPGLVVELHETHALLHQSARQQAVVGERGLTRLGAIQFQRLCGSLPMSIRSGAHGLHPERHFERIDARGDFGIAGDVEAHLIELR